MRTKVQIDNRCGYKLPLKRKISKIVNLLFKNSEITKNSAVSGLAAKSISFDIVLTGNSEIHSINRKFRQIDAPTDVITFALFADDENKFVFEGNAELGEIIISVKKAQEQTQGSLEKEILTLICHGILHLLGFDHQTDKDYNFIIRIQEDVISKL